MYLGLRPQRLTYGARFFDAISVITLTSSLTCNSGPGMGYKSSLRLTEEVTEPTWLLHRRVVSIDNKMRRACHPDGEIDGVTESSVKKIAAVGKCLCAEAKLNEDVMNYQVC